MYNAHRGMAQPASRLEEYISGIRQEFENATSGASESDQRSKLLLPIEILDAIMHLLYDALYQ